MKFREYLNEATDDKVIYVADELWVTYGQSSGQTTYLPDIKKHLTDKKEDKNYDSLVTKLVKFSRNTKPLKSKSTKGIKGESRLYELPVYPLARNGNSYDIWGGDIKPIKMYYIVIYDSVVSVVNIFDSKNEATNWLKFIAD